MKKIALLIFLGAISSVSITKCNRETIGTYINHFMVATRMIKIGDVITSSIYDFGSTSQQRFIGSLTAIAGSGALFLGTKRLYLDIKTLLNLWKKFEKREKFTIDWRLIPRNIILSTLAVPATLYGFVAALVGLGALFQKITYYDSRYFGT